MGNKRKHEDRARVSAASLRQWMEDWVGTHRTTYEDCVAALRAEGYDIPLGGTRWLWDLWAEVYGDTYGRGLK
jgi:hypothetical protein